MATLQQVAVSLGLVAAAAACDGKIIGPGGATDDAAVDGVQPIDARLPPPIPADCLEAANRGLMWLVTQQAADGSWGTRVKVATTAFAVLKLETYAWEIGQSAFDPGFIYFNQVKAGLNYLFLQGTRTPIVAQPAGNPDADGNGMGIQFSQSIYENAISLMAVAAGSEPDQVVTTPGSALNGLTFRAVVQDSVDFFAYAQSDSAASSPTSCTRGGWRYTAFDRNGSVGDNSVTQWATLALEYARHPLYRYQIESTPWVMTELRDWTTCVQDRSGGANNGASGYTYPGDIVNAYKTGALVQQGAFLGDTPNTPAIGAALGYLERTWLDTTGVGWKRNGTSDYLAMYSIMKGMESMAISDLNGIDWYRQFCDQLKAEQLPDGSWPSSQWERDPVGGAGLNSTEWALLVLERAAPPPEVIP